MSFWALLSICTTASTILHTFMPYMDKMKQILHILEVEVVRDFILRVEFNDGKVKTVDVKPLLTGPIFKALNDPDFFAKVSSSVPPSTSIRK